MFKLFCTSCTRFARLWLMCWTDTNTQPRAWPQRVGLVLAWPLFVAFQCLHWLGFGLDELLFSAYRQVQVKRPIFVVGPPRSGTTHLHHVLSQDPSTTTFSTWECLFGLSITARKLILGMIRVDRAFGRPVATLINWLERKVLSSMDDVHPFSLSAPEEDFLAFMPLGQCFILVALFPSADWLWQTARLDVDQDASARQQWLEWYQRCVQKHMFVHGSERTFLSKNASFSGSVETLLSAFPDASLMVCSRDPVKTVPSQLSSLLPALKAAGFDTFDPEFQQQLINLLAFYYLHLADSHERHSDRMVFLDNDDLRHRLAGVVRETFAALDRPISAAFAGYLEQADATSKSSRSGHRYSLDQFGLTEADIHQQFAEVYARYRFGSPGTVLT